MKKVTLFKSAVLALLACVGIAACNNDATEVPTEPETYTVKLGWAGEILDVSYEPMTRATTDDLYGIQVYSTPDLELGEGETVTWNRFAYGLFDDPNNITITLSKGYKYKFEATMIVNGKNLVWNSESKYAIPFEDINYKHVALNNSFDYQVNNGFTHIDCSQANLTASDRNTTYNIPNLERLYGVLEDYNPKQNNTSAIIPMKRVSFGAKFIAAGTLATSGILEIELEQAPILKMALTEEVDCVSDVYTFIGDGSGLSDCTIENYTETIGVSFKWIRTDGSIVPLGTHNITFKRNTTTVVTVNINKDGNDENLGIVIDESETGVMPDGDEVTITNGEMQ